MTKWIVGVIILIIIVGAGWYFRDSIKDIFVPPQTATQTQPPADPTASWAMYASSTGEFSIKYPPGYTVNASFENTTVSPTKPIAGVSFTIPTAVASGTNLASDTYISVEQLPHAKNCTGDIFLADNVVAQDVVDNGITYSVATSSDAAAGNRYEETIYAIKDSVPCTAVRYSVHYGVLENYPAGSVQQFDEAALTSSFDQIRRTLQMLGNGSTPAPTSTLQQ